MNTAKLKSYNKKRNDHIEKLRYDKHMTLQEIANKFNITRERVRQILLGYLEQHPEWEGLRISHRAYAIDERIKVIECKQCSTPFPISIKLNRKFCDRKCFHEWIHNHRKIVTIEDRRQRDRIRMNKYYHEHKNDEHYKAKLEQYRKKARENGYYKKYYQMKRKNQVAL